MLDGFRWLKYKKQGIMQTVFANKLVFNTTFKSGMIVCSLEHSISITNVLYDTWLRNSFEDDFLHPITQNNDKKEQPMKMFYIP